MRGRRLGLTRLSLLLAALVAAAVGLAAHAGGLMDWLERDSVDARFSLRGSLGPARDIAVLGIEPESLKRLSGYQYPFPRRFDARVIEDLRAAGARLIVYDLSFDTQADARDEAALRAAARRGAPIIFATTVVEQQTGETEVLGGDVALEALGDEAAAANLPYDPDGVVRHTVSEYHHLPAIAADVAHRLLHSPPPRSAYEGGWIDFRGGPGTFREVPFVNVLRGHFDSAAVRGKVVVVGATAPVLQDTHPTAAGGEMSGPELQANAIATALSDFPLRSAPGVVTVLLILALAALAPFTAARFGTLGALAALLVGGALFSLATQLTFDSGTVLAYSDPMLALLTGALAAMTLGLIAERRERRELRLRFAADSGGLVEQVLNDPRGRPLAPTAIIGGYRLEEVLARGGMGVIYRATQLALRRQVAIKLISPERAEDPAFRERFELEARGAAAIEHASIIPVYEAGEDHGLLFIAMRLVEGADLGAMLDRGGALEPKRAVRLLAQVAGALDAAHSAGIVHRDVKPANILVTVDEPEHAYLTDFGVAKQIGEPAHLTRAGQWVGTLDYLAPEQIRSEEVDGTADVYSLTAVLFGCLTGRPPYDQPTDAARLWAHLSAQPPSARALRPTLPAAIDAVIARGLAKTPAERWSSAAELARAAARALGVAEIEIEIAPPASPPAAPGARTAGHPAGAHRAGEPDATATLISE